MPRELTQLDKWKKSYSQLIKINQKMRYISSGYYIDYDGVIYMESLVPFLETVVTLHEPDKVRDFFGCMVMPNALFDFSKQAKKTKLTIAKEDGDDNMGPRFLFGQTDNDTITHVLNIVNPIHDITYASNNLLDKMYKRFFTNSKTHPEFTQYSDSETFENLPMEMVKKLYNSEAVYYEYNNTVLTFTKHLILDIKKDDQLAIARMGFEHIEKDQFRVYYRLKHTTDLYTSITLFNVLQRMKVE